MNAFRCSSGLVLLLALVPALAPQTSAPDPGRLCDAFAPGWMLLDTNGDGILDAVAGKVVVPENSTAAVNAAAANVAARIGYATTGLNMPLVIAKPEDRNDGPRIWVSAQAAPAKYAPAIAALMNQLQQNEGGVFELEGNLVVLGQSEAGLMAAAEAYAAHAPYLWKAPGEKLIAIPQLAGQSALLSGVTYRSGTAGVNRAFLRTGEPVASAALETALKSARLDQVHELVAIAKNGATASFASEKPLPVLPVAAPPPSATADAAADAPPQRLDLATLYTMRGLFRGTPKMPIPSNLDSQLYVPAGPAGLEMANLAARMGLETTGITLPLAKPAVGVPVKEVRTKAVIAGDSELSKEVLRRMQADVPGVPGDSLSPGEGELHVIDKAFGKQPAVLVQGDAAGTAAALQMLSGHFPNLWETGKQFGTLEEIRYDLHRFFALRSGAGQASVALYRLNQWMDQIRKTGGPVHDVEAKVFADLADPRLTDFARVQINSKLGVLTRRWSRPVSMRESNAVRITHRCTFANQAASSRKLHPLSTRM